MILSLVAMPIAIASANLTAESSTLDVERRYLRWEQRLRNRIAGHNIVPAATKDDPACNVVVGFTVGKSRRPANVEVVKSSCDSFYNRRAKRMVRELGRVGMVPSLSDGNHRVLLDLAYGGVPNDGYRPSDALESERQAGLLRNLRIVTAGVQMPASVVRGAE